LLASIVVGVLTLGSGAAQAGDGNTLYLVQESSPWSTNGNTLQSDQSRATNSSIGWRLLPATQNGSGNDAEIALVGNGGQVGFWQDNRDRLSNPLAYNSASISLTGDGLVTLVQLGGGNVADLTLDNGGRGSITQSGLYNEAALVLHGGADGSITQLGDGNTTALDVTAVGSGGAHVLQTGVALEYGTIDQPIIVHTTSDVTIWQHN
jgi:hypothetical protein